MLAETAFPPIRQDSPRRPDARHGCLALRTRPLQVKAQAALILAIVEREIGDLETVALEDEKKDERDCYKAAEAGCDITRADDQADHRDELQDGGGGDAGDKPVAPDDRAGADEPFVQFRVGSRRDDATPGTARAQFSRV